MGGGLKFLQRLCCMCAQQLEFLLWLCCVRTQQPRLLRQLCFVRTQQQAVQWLDMGDWGSAMWLLGPWQLLVGKRLERGCRQARALLQHFAYFTVKGRKPSWQGGSECTWGLIQFISLDS